MCAWKTGVKTNMMMAVKRWNLIAMTKFYHYAGSPIIIKKFNRDKH